MVYNVAIVGATGAVGQVMRQILEERDFPVARLRLLASARSLGKRLLFKGEEIPVEELKESSFQGIDIVLSSAGSAISRWFVPYAVKAGAVVIDNTSAFRMDPETPLVVPEVNPEEIKRHKGIIANPNCSTIQLVVVLRPLHDAAGVKRAVISTYQAVSGAGLKASFELKTQSQAVLNGKKAENEVFPHQIAFNVLPQIPQKNAFGPDGYTEEETKMINETKKIMGDQSIELTATCVRVPVFVAHSEAVNIETHRKLTAQQAREILAAAPGVTVLDDPGRQLYPLAVEAEGKDDTFVGRIREDLSTENGLALWIVSDNLRKGAALNAVQIAELI